MKHYGNFVLGAVLVGLVTTTARAGVGDPQIRTDHVWYPGELACSTFQRLFVSQAELYCHVVGVTPTTDEQKALAAWLWRNTHYWHGEEGAEDLWGKGFTHGSDLRTRAYWTGLFAHGFGLCGTTHSQWAAEMEALLGHGRGRAVGVEGHNSFEVFLTGGPYGAGKWVLLDHDLSTVIYSPDGSALLSIAEIQRDWRRLIDRQFAPQRQHGWLVCGLHPADGSAYRSYKVAEYLPGYSGPPPLVHLRRGETLRRYLRPGLDDGHTFVFWGRNYRTQGIPGPERAQTWVNQPDKMYGSREGTPFRPGQARYANAVYTYKPDFASGDYREGAISEDAHQVTFEFYTPYIIAATPANDHPWGIYEPGGRNGLVLRGQADCLVSISVDQGATWQEAGRFRDGLDLTDFAKGRRQYFLRFHAAARALAWKGLTITTVCQANSSVMPRLKDQGSTVRFAASGRAVVSAGPNLPQAQAHCVAGKFGSPEVTLEVATPRGEPALEVYAAAHVLSGSPPQPEIRYQIEMSTDAGRTWRPIVRDWTVPRRGQEPKDFWSQSFCWGRGELNGAAVSSVRVRFRNNGGKRYARGEVHLVYRPAGQDATQVTLNWTDDRGAHQLSHRFAGSQSEKADLWQVPTGRGVETRWVEMTPTP